MQMKCLVLWVTVAEFDGLTVILEYFLSRCASLLLLPIVLMDVIDAGCILSRLLIPVAESVIRLCFKSTSNSRSVRDRLQRWRKKC